MDLVHALGLAGIPVAPAVPDWWDPAVHSRFSRGFVRTPPLDGDPEALVAALLRFARGLDEKPVLYYQYDPVLLTLSRHRDVLSRHFRLLLPEAGLVEDTVDKVRFAAFAERHALPVPETLALVPGNGIERALQRWEHFPAVLKPAHRSGWFGSMLARSFRAHQKALRLEGREMLEALVPRILSYPHPLVLQQCVEGGEERVLSYHAYVRPGGERVAEFTGRKVRTWARTQGASTCVEITDDAEVREAGRDILARIGFHGVVKLDMKRDARTGQLYLLEINPRFNLWHYPAAVAGVNLPQLIYQDQLEPGSARTACRARPGVRYVTLPADFLALWQYRAAGELSILGWLHSVVGSEVWRELSLGDPVPSAFKCAQLARGLLQRVPGFVRSRWEPRA